MIRPLSAFAALAFLAAPALAQYKVIGPDGSVTYTDRPPTGSNARSITQLNRRGEPASAPAQAAAEASLPFELRQAATRFPVVLYTSDNCVPCDSGRTFLQQRGIPFTERRVANEEDAAALERAVGGRTVPALTVGSQALRGLSQTDWTIYLDAAGYPRESRLPRSYQQAQAASAPSRTAAPRTPGNVTPQPLVPDAAPAAAAPVQPAPPASGPTQPPTPASPVPEPGVRF